MKHLYRPIQAVHPVPGDRRFATKTGVQKKRWQIVIIDTEEAEEHFVCTVTAINGREAYDMGRKRMIGSKLMRRLGVATMEAREMKS